MQTKVILGTEKVNKDKSNRLKPQQAATGVYEYHPSNTKKREKLNPLKMRETFHR